MASGMHAHVQLIVVLFHLSLHADGNQAAAGGAGVPKAKAKDSDAAAQRDKVCVVLQLCVSARLYTSTYLPHIPAIAVLHTKATPMTHERFIPICEISGRD